jgi:alpha,alpha-trehalose phosphorylase
MNVVYGFGGLVSGGETISLSPVLPECWDSLRFKLVYRGRTLVVDVTRDKTTVRLENGEPVKIILYGEEYECVGN